MGSWGRIRGIPSSVGVLDRRKKLNRSRLIGKRLGGGSRVRRGQSLGSMCCYYHRKHIGYSINTPRLGRS